MSKTAHIYITGRVQGVFFRAETQRTARQLGLHGWVRNLRDGRVEALIHGQSEKVERMIVWCHQGPPHSRVTHIELNWLSPSHEIEENFEIRNTV